MQVILFWAGFCQRGFLTLRFTIALPETEVLWTLDMLFNMHGMHSHNQTHPSLSKSHGPDWCDAAGISHTEFSQFSDQHLFLSESLEPYYRMALSTVGRWDDFPIPLEATPILVYEYMYVYRAMKTSLLMRQLEIPRKSEAFGESCNCNEKRLPSIGFIFKFDFFDFQHHGYSYGKQWIWGGRKDKEEM